MPKAPARTLALRPADPFDLIRWLARSQSDPRKAVAELVQNSIDARARRVAVERRRLRGGPALVVRDDEEALRFIATNIGSSQKRHLSAEERRRLVVTGQYGVGLLGFWSIGHRMRSRVAGSALHVLRLVEDAPRVALTDAMARGLAQKRFPAEAGVRPGATARLRVEAEQDGRRAAAEAAVEAVEPRMEEAGLGIPEPNLVDAPGQTWRSRFDGARWEVNAMHEDYLSLKGEARARLRYLVALLAKDLAQRAHPVPGAAEASEDVAAILALAERNLRGT